MMDPAFFARAFGAFFAIMNPFVALPIFLSLTAGLGSAATRRRGLAAVFYAAVMCAIVALAGQRILSFFGINVDDFRVAGGLVLLLIGLGMVNGRDSPAHQRTAAERAADADADDGNVAFYPMAFPMIVGPGTIATLLIFTGQAHDAAQMLSVWAAAALVLAMTAVVLAFAPVIGRYLGQTLRVIMTRIMGMILAAIAAGMIAQGLKSLLPGLG